jgi:pimeloyl-ACP methyl ester carboxylesterase
MMRILFCVWFIKMNLKPGIHGYDIIIKNHSIHFLYDYKPDSTELILFMHGLACSGDSFRNLFDSNNFPQASLLVPDLIGFGQSSKPDDFSYSMEDQALVCENLLNLFPANQLHIVAHSMGNAIALLFSQNVLSKVQSYANLEGNLISEDCGLLSRVIIGVPFQEYQNCNFRSHLYEFSRHSQLRFNQTTANAVYKSSESLVRWSDSDELLDNYKNLSCRKCYFCGDENADMPVLKVLAGMKTIMIPDSGHGMMTDNPKAFYTALSYFINI